MCVFGAGSGRAAQTINQIWVGGLTGTFESNANWINVRIPNTDPGFDDNVLIDNGNNLIASVVTINSAAKIRDLFISTGDTLDITNGHSLTLFSTLGTGTIENNGLLKLSSSGSATEISLKTGTFTFSGSGSLTLSNQASNKITGNSATEQLVNAATHTIQGSGQLGVNSLAITNAGTVLANGSAGLVIDPDADGFINTGTLRATNGATLMLQNGVFTNTGGLIKADDNSHVDLVAATITGGTLTSIGAGHFHAYNASTLSDLTLSSGSNLEVDNNQMLRLLGTIENNGTIKLFAGGNNTDLFIAGNVTLTGNGQITLSNDTNNRIYGASAATTLINQSNTISGVGHIGLDLLTLDNRGLIKANISGGTLTLSPGTGATSTLNSGTLQAVSGGVLRIENGTIVNTGGTIRADASSKVELASAEISGGTLTTSGTGSIRTASGSNTLSGAVTLSSGSLFKVVNNTSLLLPASGTFTNDGTLSLGAAGNLTNLIVGPGTTTLAGTGTIELSDDFNNRIYGGGGADRLVLNSTGTIKGAGQIGVNLMGLTNEGTIKATLSTNLFIDPSAAGVTNTGLLRAETGSTLRLEHGAFTNTNGEIEAFGVGARVTFDDVTITGGELRSNTGAALQNVSTSTFSGIALVGGSTFNIQNNTTANFSGTLQNAANINLTAGGNLTNFVVSGGDLTLDGGGVVTLSNDSNNRIYAGNSAHRLLNLNNTIQGAGQIGVNLMGLANSATITATQTTPLVIDPSAAGVTNTGLLRAETGSKLQLQHGAFANAGGQIEAFGTGAIVEFNDVTITGGELRSNGGAALHNTSSSTFTDINLVAGSTFKILNNTSAIFTGTLHNLATVQLNAGGNLTDFIVSGGDLTLEGGGFIALSNDGNNRIYAATPTQRLLNLNNTIQGSGQIGVNLMGLVNSATITANQTTALVIDPSAAGVTNTGALRAEAGATLALQGGTFTNTDGTIEAIGTGSRVTFDNVSVVNGQLSSGTGGKLRNISTSTFTDVTLATGSLLEIANNTTAGFLNTFTNLGTLQMNAGGNLTNVIVTGGDLTLDGGGTIALSNDFSNRIYADNSAHRLINLNNTIRGSGQIGVNLMGVSNAATIVADQSTPLVIDPSAAGFTNSGLLRAEAGASLELENGVFTNHGGTIEAFGAGSKVNFIGASVFGGDLISSGGGTLRNIGGSTFSDVTFTSGTTFDVLNNTSATFLGTIVNDGAIKLSAGGNLTNLLVGVGGVTLVGDGVVELSNDTNNRIYGVDGTVTLTNYSTIRGSGQIGVNQLNLVNHQTIAATGTSPLTLDVSGTSFQNNGRLQAQGTGGLHLSDTAVTNSGYVEIFPGSHVTAAGTFTQTSAGITVLDSSVLTATSLANNGLVGGSGTIAGNFTNHAFLSPGGTIAHSGVGTLSFNDALTLSGSSVIHFELGGNSPPNYDRILAPSATLGGGLLLTFANGFQSSVSPLDSFTLLTTTNATGLSGTFLGLANGARFNTFDGLGNFQVNYTANSFTLSNFVPVPEPETYALLGVGALAIFLARRRRR